MWTGILLSVAAGAQQESTASFEEQLERAAILDVTAPWRETRALLEEIEPGLSTATPEQRARFRLIRARNLTLAGDMELALEDLQSLFSEPLTRKQAVRAHALAANIAMLLRRWEETFTYLNRALELSDGADTEAFPSVPFGLAAYVHAQLGNTERATEYGKRAVELAETHGNARDICTDNGRLAFVYKIAGEYVLAEDHYQRAIAACRTAGDDLAAGAIESGMADLLRARGDLARSAAHFEQALAQLERADFAYGLAEARFYKARLHWQLNERETAAELLEQALPTLEEDEAWDYVAESQQMLGAIDFDRGEHEAALAHARRRLEAREHFLDRDRARQLAHLQVAFDMRSREQELALLREQGRAARLQSESRRNRDLLRWLLYAFAGLLFLALTLLLAHVLRERRHYRRLAGLDSLTGLDNHTRFFDSVRQRVDETQLTGAPLVLVIGDVDHFKHVNDAFGHIVGDQALQEIAGLLQRHFPRPALLGRIGGEEFAVCLPGESIDPARERLDVLRSALGRIEYGARGEALTMSFGVAARAPGETMDQLRERADEALYRAKGGGRNRVTVATRPWRDDLPGD